MSTERARKTSLTVAEVQAQRTPGGPRPDTPMSGPAKIVVIDRRSEGTFYAEHAILEHGAVTARGSRKKTYASAGQGAAMQTVGEPNVTKTWPVGKVEIEWMHE